MTTATIILVGSALLALALAVTVISDGGYRLIRRLRHHHPKDPA